MSELALQPLACAAKQWHSSQPIHAPLQGRATVQMDFKLKEKRENGVAGGTLTIVADGYNAPVTAGNFVDLVNRGFYNNMEVQRADGFIVQTGNPGPPVLAPVPATCSCVMAAPVDLLTHRTCAAISAA